jgi:hypothetical protein
MNAYRILVGKPKEKDIREDLNVDVGIILRWILERMGWYGLY